MYATLSSKLEHLKAYGHKITYHKSGGKYIITRYDEFSFVNTKEDQDLAREMLNLDFEILLLNRD